MRAEGSFLKNSNLSDSDRSPIIARSGEQLQRLAITLFLFSIYLLLYRGGFHSIDEVSIFAVTENLVKFGRFDTNQIAWSQWATSQAEAQGFFGLDGQVYSKKGLALSLAQAPLYGLALVLPGLGMLQTVSLLNAFITAATGLLIFIFLRRLGFSALTALITTLIFGLATPSLVYAKYLFSEPLAGLLLLAAAYLLFVYKQEGGLASVFIAGLASGFAILTRANNLFLLPVFGLYLVAAAGRFKPTPPALRQLSFEKTLVQAIGAFGLGLAAPGAILLVYNAVRSGNPFQTGYDLTLFSPNILVGLYKLLFSPLRGLFIYSPILLLSLPGWWSLRRLHPAEAWLFAGLIGLTLVLFSTWSSGEGLSWGSRFLVPLIPFFTLSLAPLVNRLTKAETETTLYALRTTHHAPRFTLHLLPWHCAQGRCFIFYVLLPLSLLIQLLGALINPWVFLARLQAEFGGEFFLENTAALYDFRYSQIAGQIQNWSLENSDLAWRQPWGFNALAFSLSFSLVLLSGWLLWHAFTHEPQDKPAKLRLTLAVRSLPVELRAGQASYVLPSPYLSIFICLAVTYFLLARYYQTDRQFGPPDDAYTIALNTVANNSKPGQAIITVAPYHYHTPMNRFKARLPLIGFAQQAWPPPQTALPLLAAAAKNQTIWQVSVGFPPADPNNAAERWLAANTFKVSDDWFPNQVRLARFSPAQPAATQPVGVAFEHEIRLLTVTLATTSQPGQPLPVEFTWQPTTQPKADYNLFLQLLGPDGALVAQHDSPPNGGYTPTSTWTIAQPTISRHALLLPPTLAAGEYRLIAGLYNPATGQRLLLDNQADFIELSVITITKTAGVES